MILTSGRLDETRLPGSIPRYSGRRRRTRLAMSGAMSFQVRVSLTSRSKRIRRFKVTERATLEFRAESFNFTNTPQYPNPDGGFGNATFGQITNAAIGNAADGGSRQIQLGLRLLF